MTRPLTGFGWLLCVALAAASAACAPAPKPPVLAGSGMDMFAPVTLRVHPLSRLLADPPRVEAHVELADQMGDIGKGVGIFTFTLCDYSLVAAGHRGRTLATWTEPLTLPGANQQHYDAITRTYVFMLPLPPGALAPATHRIVLHAALRKPNGDVLSNDLTMNLSDTP